MGTRNDTVLFGESICEAWPEGVSHAGSADNRIYLVRTGGMIMNIRRSLLGQLNQCPNCQAERVAAEIDDYICCWCRDDSKGR